MQQRKQHYWHAEAAKLCRRVYETKKHAEHEYQPEIPPDGLTNRYFQREALFSSRSHCPGIQHACQYHKEHT